MSLVICGECRRHVRRRDSRCPFCRSEIPAALAMSPERPLPTRRLSRAALMAFAAASLGTACGGKSTDSSQTNVGDPGNSGGTTGVLGAGGATAGGGLRGGILPSGGAPVYGAPFGPGGAFGSGGFLGAGGFSVPPPPPPYGAPPPPPPLTDGSPGFDAGRSPSSGGSAHDAGRSVLDASADADTTD